MRAQDPQGTKDITCPFDTEEPKAVFTISTSLPVAIRNRFMDVFMELGTRAKEKPATVSESYGHYREIVKVGLKGLVNTYGGKGNAITMNGHVTDEVLDSLSEIRLKTGFDNLVNWLGSEIWKANTLADEEKKS